jgi:hypothetical protein
MKPGRLLLRIAKNKIFANVWNIGAIFFPVRKEFGQIIFSFKEHFPIMLISRPFLYYRSVVLFSLNCNPQSTFPHEAYDCVLFNKRFFNKAIKDFKSANSSAVNNNTKVLKLYVKLLNHKN